ncbi:hypothetical protein CHELA20_53500 [Hyphomicrobiales bacterium]|nr:hypothetical protein CHELA41_21427 [Hyphomicrobiales bacterium]CAH1684374.1 hypothetical protein CHELA20_53500 [Hyphomicrobiales bacterium]
MKVIAIAADRVSLWAERPRVGNGRLEYPIRLPTTRMTHYETRRAHSPSIMCSWEDAG